MRILYFAWVREAIGRDSETLSVPDGIGTVSDLLGWLAGRGGAYRIFRDTERLRFAADEQIIPLSASIAGTSEIAIFPPVSGG
jgi:sulfur-carrier protein